MAKNDIYELEIAVNSYKAINELVKITTALTDLAAKLTSVETVTKGVSTAIEASFKNMGKSAETGTKGVAKAVQDVGEAMEGSGESISGGFSSKLSNAFQNINWSRVIRDFQGFGSVLGGALGGPLGMVLGSSIGGAIDGVFKLIGNVISGIKDKIADFVRFAVGEIDKLISSLIKSASYFQQLDIFLGTAIARQGVREGLAPNIREAYGEAEKYTGALLAKIQEITIKTPYAVEEVVRMFKAFTGRGMDIQPSLDLIVAMSDMAGGIGLTSLELERLSRNLIQVATTGKLFERDIYEFGNVGIDVAAILRDEFNMSIEDARKALKDGTIDMDSFTQAFVRFAKTNFEGAGERLTNTIEGLRQKISDVMGFVGLDIFKPLLDQVAIFGNKIFDAFQLVLNSGVFQLFGKTLANMFGGAVKSIDTDVNSIAKVIMSFLVWVSKQARVFSGWGFRLIEQFGVGMIKAAIQVVTKVIRIISSILKMFLKPGSPPKAIPDIDKWGYGATEAYIEGMVNGLVENASKVASAANTAIGGALSGIGAQKSEPIDIGASISGGKLLEGFYKWGIEALANFMKGFTSADFDILEQMQDPIEEVLKRLGLGANEITAMLQEITVGFSEALGKFKLTGVIDESFFQRIADATGKFGFAVVDLTRSLFDLVKADMVVEKATKKVTEAQKRLETQQEKVKESQKKLEDQQKKLEQANKVFDDADVKVRKLVQEYNDLVRAGASTDVLSAKKKEIDEAMKGRGIARENIDLAEKGVERAKEVLDKEKEKEDKLRDILDLAQKELDIAEENRKKIQDRIQSQKKLLDQLLKLTEYEEKEKDNLKDIGDGLGDIGDELKNIGEGWEDIVGEELDLDKMFEEEMHEIDLNLKLLERNWLITLAKLRSSWNEVDWDTLMLDLNTALGGLSSSFQGVLDVLTKPDGLNDALKNFALNLLGINFDEVTGTVSLLKLFPGTTFSIDFNDLFQAGEGFHIGEFIAGLFGVGYDDSYWQQKLAPFREGWKRFWSGEGAVFGDITAQSIVQGIFTALFGAVARVIQGLALIFDPIARDQFIADYGAAVGETWLGGIWTGITNWSANLLNNIGKWFKDWFAPGSPPRVVPEIYNWGVATIGEFINGLLNGNWSLLSGITTKISERWGEIKTTTATKWGEIKTEIDTKVTEISTKIQGFINEKKVAWDTFWAGAKTTATTKWGEIKTEISTKVDEIATKIKTFIDDKKVAWDTFWEGLRTKVNDVITTIRNWISEKFTEIGTFFSPLQTFVDNLASAFTTLKDGISTAVDWLSTFLTNLGNAIVPDWFLDLFPGSPPPFSVGMKVNTKEFEKFSKSIGGFNVGVSAGRMTPSTMRGTQNNNVFNFGNNNINSGMDSAMFETMVQRSLARALS